MRVFISWSGERSHAVAAALKIFIGDIIQSVTPFVSDEDIINGERWTKRLQEELQENQYGILSITNDNKESPWLLFEAGALSNSANKIPVVPFLFDIEPSELTGSPLLQFQATIYYNKDNLKKLINEINDASGENKLDNYRLERAFDRCYDEFESKLNKITPKSSEPKDIETDKTHTILEELLDMTRSSNKMLNNNDNQNINAIERIEKLIENFDIRNNKNGNLSRMRFKRKFHPMMVEELLHYSRHEKHVEYGILILLSLFREDFPWLYDAGKDTINTIKSTIPHKMKPTSVYEFQELVEFTFHNPAFTSNNDKEELMMMRDLSSILTDYFMIFLKENEEYLKQQQIFEKEFRNTLSKDQSANFVKV